MSNSTQSNVLYSNEIFKQYLMQISTGIVWKNTSRANDNESTDLVELYQAELFVVANRGLLNFDVVKAFPRSVLLNSAIPESNIEIYASDKRKIPEYLRKTVVAEYTKALTSVNPVSGRPGYLNRITGDYETIYEESNNYYRMLMGLPNKDDYDYIYNTDARWSRTTPIHEMSFVDRIEMERAGILDELLKKYPSKEYINHLGKKYIDPFTARIADRFEILYHDESPSDVLNTDFMNSYNNARQVAISVYYNNSLRKTNALYDNFLAMCILFMTIQEMQYKYLQVDITRDFYDTESLKLVYDSYGVPFYHEIPLEYHRKIVKNINKLISYKGSSQVFFDLFEIFDLGEMDIYSYFLTKTHIMTEEGIPLFNIKKDEDGNDMYDEEGNPILDDSNYKIKFSRVKIYDDPSLAISDDANDVEYEDLTADDPYWIEDAELAAKLAGEDFNYLESKYLGIQTIFDLMKITFENAYIFRMITDNKELTDRLGFRWSDAGITCSLFDIFIYLSAIYCRYYGYEGIITNKIPAIMDTLGYDFEQSLNIIRYGKTIKKLLTSEDEIYATKDRQHIDLSDKLIENYEIIQGNTNLINLITRLEITDINSIDKAYETIVTIRDLIIEGYTNATTIEEFNAYRGLYNALMISKEVTGVYKNPNTGDIYESFTDLLTDTCPVLMQRYLLLEDSELENEIIAVTDQIDSLIQSLKYLPLSAGLGPNSMIEQLFRILKFFKSAKAELVDYNIIYKITMRGLNFFKLMDLFTLVITEAEIDDYTYFIDIVKVINDTIKHKTDLLPLIEEVSDINSKIYLQDYINKLTDMIVVSTTIMDYIFRSEAWYIDFLKEIQSRVEISSNILINDISTMSLTQLEILEAKYKGLIKDSINRLTDNLKENPNVPIIYYILESLNAIDKIKIIMNQIPSNNTQFNSDGSSEDILTSLTIQRFDSFRPFIDMIELIISEDFSNLKENGSNIDNIHIAGISKNEKDIHSAVDALLSSDNNIKIENYAGASDYLYEFKSDGSIGLVV